MCIIIRYFDDQQKKVMSSLWELAPLFEAGDFTMAAEGATAEAMYDLIIKKFSDRGIPLENIIGFASDGCNVMMGSQNSVASRLRENLPGIFIFKCICHSMHLCASEACKKLPRRCEDLARNIYGFFKLSSKRQAQYLEFQVFTNSKIHKILHPSQTRWLSLLSVVNRLLEQWNSLKLFFTQKWLEEKTVAAELIYRELHDDFIKLYLLFLQWILPKFIKLNEYFQSADSKLVELDEHIRLMYKELLMCYMQRDYVQQNVISSIAPEDTRYFLPEMYLGVKIMIETQKPDISTKKEELKEFYSRCRDFLITGCKEIKKRYDFSDDLLQLLKYLSPEEAASNQTRNVCPSILPLMQKLPRIVNNADDFQKIDDEWRILPVVNKLPLYEISSQKTDEFWIKIRDGTELKTLASFALNVLCLPYSNADCERIFSEVNNMKTRLRNKLITSTINGTLLARQAIRNHGNCTNFQVPSEMIRKMKDKKKDDLNATESEVLETIQNLYGEE
ncbi:unnamed protein product [Parnassius mnemosyne]